MNYARFVLLLAIALSTGITAKAQKDETKPLATTNAPQASTTPVANPVSTFVKQQLTRFNKIMVAAAEAMPAEKYSFKPTPDMNTFAHLTIHIAQGNNGLCSQISGAPAPTSDKLGDDDPKDKLVAGLKASFDFCATALANVDDSKLGEPLTLFGRVPSSRAGALIALSMGFADHYGAQAMYLRLSGILPPTAQPKK
ncbi:MAG TPA: DinB family protein [Candidatus Acidoferrales bacterium]|jgi:DinB superfamily|nr:DinB family protein [Candidatus Acidoferrales bacterium]